eukprot:scaffold377_cov563-Prasinococcus_capsulatus_cf.AAC.3
MGCRTAICCGCASSASLSKPKILDGQCWACTVLQPGTTKHIVQAETCTVPLPRIPVMHEDGDIEALHNLRQLRVRSHCDSIP